MSLPILLEPEARAEYDDAHSIYRRARKGLAPRFRKAIDDCLKRLKKSALAHQVIYPPDVRRALVTGFPYAVIYRVAPAAIRVISVFHTSRDPAVWQRRADDASGQTP
jgi:plasmid stabilization system protein ParE